MKLSTLFERCCNVPYRNVENCASYAAERLGSTLYLYFEASNGAVDWRNNLDFPAKVHRRSCDTAWFVHRGFLRVWRSAEKELAAVMMDPEIRRVAVVGYSHGAALAVLCYEHIWFHRPDLRGRMEGYGFGCPRVLWSILPKQVRQRWERFTVVRNQNDIVTHLPPAGFGYRHVGKLLRIGAPGRYSAVDAHRPENILEELKNYEKSHSDIHCLQF